MRLTVPRTKIVRDEKTGAELAYVGGSANRDMLGTIYRMTVPQDDGVICVTVIASNMTYSPADKYAKSVGIDVSQMSVSDYTEFVQRYADEHGAMFDVSKFDVEPLHLNGGDLIDLRNQFLRLLFDNQSSYRYNKDNVEESEEYYPDKVQFYPYDIDRTICGVFYKDDL